MESVGGHAFSAILGCFIRCDAVKLSLDVATNLQIFFVGFWEA